MGYSLLIHCFPKGSVTDDGNQLLVVVLAKLYANIVKINIVEIITMCYNTVYVVYNGGGNSDELFEMWY